MPSRWPGWRRIPSEPPRANQPRSMIPPSASVASQTTSAATPSPGPVAIP